MWLDEAQRRVGESSKFRSLCKDIVARLNERGDTDRILQATTNTERDAIIDEVYASMATDAYEEVVAAELDDALTKAVLATPKPVLLSDTVEKLASEAIVDLLEKLPREHHTGALRGLVGRPLPAKLRPIIWDRRLSGSTMSRTYRENERVAARAAVVLGVHMVDMSSAEFAALKAALSIRDDLPLEVIWLGLPITRVFGKLDGLTRRIDCALDAVLDADALGFLVCGQPQTDDDDDLLDLRSGAVGPGRYLSSPKHKRRRDEKWDLPLPWTQRLLFVIADADKELLDALLLGISQEGDRYDRILDMTTHQIDLVNRGFGRAIRTGLAGVLPLDITLFVWDQCILSTFAVGLPLAGATLAILLRSEILRLLSTCADENSSDGAREQRFDAIAFLLKKRGVYTSPRDFEGTFRRAALPRLREAVSQRNITAVGSSPLTKLRGAVLPSSAHDEDLSAMNQEELDVHRFSFRPSEPLRCGAHHLDWVSIVPATDDLETIVDGLIKHNGLSGSIEESVALAVATLFPALIPLYEVVPATLKPILDEATTLNVALPRRRRLLFDQDDQDEVTLVLPTVGQTFVPTAIWGLRARGLWPRRSAAVPTLADQVRTAFRSIVVPVADPPPALTSPRDKPPVAAAHPEEEVSNNNESSSPQEEEQTTKLEAVETAEAVAAEAVTVATAEAVAATEATSRTRERVEEVRRHEATVARVIETTQTKIFHQTYSPEAVAAMDAKTAKKYSKKHTKWVKDMRKAWDADHDGIRAAIPDTAALDAVLRGYAVPHH